MYLIALAFAFTLSTASWGACRDRHEAERGIRDLLNSEVGNELESNDLLSDEENEMEAEFQVIIPATMVTPDLLGEPLFAPMTPVLLEQLGLTRCDYADVVSNLLALRKTLNRVLEFADKAMHAEEDAVVAEALDEIGTALAAIDDHAQPVNNHFYWLLDNVGDFYNNALRAQGLPGVNFEDPEVIAQYPLIETLYGLWNRTGSLGQRGYHTRGAFQAARQAGTFAYNDLEQVVANINGMLEYVNAVGLNFDIDAFHQHEAEHPNEDDCEAEAVDSDADTEDTDGENEDDNMENGDNNDFLMFQPSHNVTRLAPSPSPTPSPVAPQIHLTLAPNLFGNGGGSAFM